MHKIIKVDTLARVEGEGSLYIKIRNGQLADVKLKIFEPPRFFEALLRGRKYSEAPDITARICGICPVAYQMSSVHAIEQAFGLQVEGQLRQLRRLLYCGEWIESHALHIYMLHAPDFLGYADAIQMAKDHPEAVKRGLELKKAGNEIVRLIGGREIHPINVRVGGFYRAPHKTELVPLLETMKKARDLAEETVRWSSSFSFPRFERDYEFVSLRHLGEYPMNEGRIVSNKGLDISVRDFEQAFEEEHVKHSNALQSAKKDAGAYLVGPLARYANNFDLLTKSVQEAARSAGLDTVCRNPFQSIVVRAVETLYACEEALRILSSYDQPEKPSIEVTVQQGMGYGCTEAPRGILYHYYQIDEKGTIQNAKIVPPTSQNQKMIESDLREFIPARLTLPEETLTLQCEQAIRNYDPCISCATHFLNLKVDRGE